MTKLLPYQEAGVQRAVDCAGRVLLADEMGLGKTLQALTYLVRQQAFPTVIVTPAFLKTHWQEEAQRHCKLKTTILWGRTPQATKAISGRVFILNYEILGGWLRFLKARKPQLIILDECHMIQNLRAQRTRHARYLCQGVSQVIAISGTPLTNRPWELFPTLNILWPNKFASPISYGLEYCDGRREFGHWKFDGAKNLPKLHKRLTKYGMIRRVKEDVLEQLPSLRKIVLPLEIKDRKQYERAEKDLVGWLSEISLVRAARAALDVRTKFGYLKRLAAQLKMEAIYAWIDTFLDASGGKLLLGAIHRHQTPIIPLLQSRYGNLAVSLHGGMGHTARAHAVQSFRNNPDTRILIGQIQAAGVGLNLPECSTVAFVELPWTPGACQQFWSRCHRLTSKNAVEVFFLIARGTIEERLCQLLQRKARTLGAVLDGEVTESNKLDVFTELSRQLKEKA